MWDGGREGEEWTWGRREKGGERGVQIEIDAQQPDDAVVLPADSNGGRLQRHSVFIFGMIRNVPVTASAFNLGQHTKGQIGNGRTFFSVGMESIYNSDDGMLHGLQAVKHQLISLSKIVSQPIQHIAV